MKHHMLSYIIILSLFSLSLSIPSFNHYIDLNNEKDMTICVNIDDYLIFEHGDGIKYTLDNPNFLKISNDHYKVLNYNNVNRIVVTYYNKKNINKFLEVPVTKSNNVTIIITKWFGVYKSNECPIKGRK